MTKNPPRLGSSPLLVLVFLLTAGPAHAMCTDPPVAVADQVDLIESLAVVDVLANDGESAGEAVTVQVLNGSCLALGTLQVLGGVISYRPHPGPLLPCSFGYRITTESGLSSDSTVSVTIPPAIFADDFEAGNLLVWSAFFP